MAQEIFAKTYNKYLKAYHDKPNPWDILRLDEDRNYSAADPKDCNDIKVAKERAPKMFSTEAVNAAGEELLHGSIWARQVNLCWLLCLALCDRSLTKSEIS